MEGFLILAGVILGVVCLILGRPRDQDSPPGESVKDVGGEHVIDSASVPPIALGGLIGFDVAGSAFGLDDESWPIDRHYETSGPFDDPGHAVGISKVDDFPVNRICINPATGLPMISDSEVGFDVGGNPYGFSNDDLSIHHDSFGSCFGSGSLDHLDSGTDWT